MPKRKTQNTGITEARQAQTNSDVRPARTPLGSVAHSGDDDLRLGSKSGARPRGSLRWVSGPRPDRPPGILEVLTQQRTLHFSLSAVFFLFFFLLFLYFFPSFTRGTPTVGNIGPFLLVSTVASCLFFEPAQLRWRLDQRWGVDPDLREHGTPPSAMAHGGEVARPSPLRLPCPTQSPS